MTAPAFDLLSLRPADTPEYMTPAWLGLIRFALGDDDMLALFRVDTGETWKPASDPLGAMIDKATGADVAFLRKFVLWVNETLWGPLS